MHEMSIALEVCRMTEDQLGGAQLANVVEVGLEVGNDAGVEIGNLQFCLEALLSAPPFTSPTLVIARSSGDVLRLSYVEVDDGRPEN